MTANGAQYPLAAMRMLVSMLCGEGYSIKHNVSLKAARSPYPLMIFDL